MIRPYVPADTEQLVSVWQAASAIAHPFLSRAFLAREAENLRTLYFPKAETWVLEVHEDGTATAVGFIALIGDEIGGLFVRPSHHGLGLGRALVEHAAALKGPLRVEVFARNVVGRRFYDRSGFVATGRYRHEASGEVMIAMVLRTSR